MAPVAASEPGTAQSKFKKRSENFSGGQRLLIIPTSKTPKMN